jgi:hypothetical protein
MEGRWCCITERYRRSRIDAIKLAKRGNQAQTNR